MLSKSELIRLLKKNEIVNVNILNFIESYPIHFAEKAGESALVKGVSDREWVYISSQSEEELKIIKDILKPEDKNFAIIENWMIPILIEEHNEKSMGLAMKAGFVKDRVVNWFEVE